jgi:beta-glucanase (GH16 family)
MTLVRRSTGRSSALLSLLLMASACTELEPLGVADSAMSRAKTPPAAPFADDFSTLDATVWALGTHNLGRGPLKPENVTVAAGSVALATRASGFEGAEIRTQQTWSTGSFTARARCAAPTGTLCTLFMYQIGVGDRADEIDIEIISGTREIWFTTWVAGKQMNHARITLPFDPASGFNSYTIDRRATEVRFLVNGVLQHIYKQKGKAKVPTSAMPLFLNSWWPTWLAPSQANGVWEIDWVEIQ